VASRNHAVAHHVHRWLPVVPTIALRALGAESDEPQLRMSGAYSGNIADRGSICWRCDSGDYGAKVER
jgi:hypothetical protein